MDEHHHTLTDTGFTQETDGRIDRIPAYNPDTAEHFWTVNTIYRWRKNPDGQTLLDMENLVLLIGPGCWYCEQPWSHEIGNKPCPGDNP